MCDLQGTLNTTNENKEEKYIYSDFVYNSVVAIVRVRVYT